MQSNNPKHLREHGTVARFRQGCSCPDCVSASETPLKDIDTLYLPDMDEIFVISEVYESVFRLVGDHTL